MFKNIKKVYPVLYFFKFNIHTPHSHYGICMMQFVEKMMFFQNNQLKIVMKKILEDFKFKSKHNV
jgi:hypothetical protein